ncbi:MAG: alpha,alpha-trehalose-phosphate synthase (UDP-forming), partial [Rhodobacteraceae bacterium]|nr:alpha,alpha-trehalose-phosphate synthase (UDP-forming) [Paracoccaceae bacterium]
QLPADLFPCRHHQQRDVAQQTVERGVVSRLIVVSNRVGLPSSRQKGAEGGLVSGLTGALRDRNGLWFGWSGQIAKETGTTVRTQRSRGIEYAVLDLSQEDYDAYYNGFANRSLWPLCHFRIDLANFDRAYYDAYMRVNATFADRLMPLLKPDDVIWVHDYHLIPLAEELRKRGAKQKIGFFLHVPWPSTRIFLVLPRHREMARALTAYDLVGFQTKRDAFAFANYLQSEAGGIVDETGVITAFGREVRLGVFPISIDTKNLAALARSPEAGVHSDRMRKSIAGRAMILGVDRLDYSKGIDRRFMAYDAMLDRREDLHGKVFFLEIAPPTRSDVPEYREIRREIELMTGRISGKFSEYDWVPLRYVNRGYSQTALAGLYRTARVGFVTPLRDGMNLVAKEYVAAQDDADPGVLILSRFAGAAAELGEALIVNPYDEDDMSEALEAALDMSLSERKRRWQTMMHTLTKHDINAWQNAFLTMLTIGVTPAAVTSSP